MHTLVRTWSHKSDQNQHLQTLPPVFINVREWNLHYHQVRQIRTIQQCHRGNILKIKWDQYISNEEVLTRAGLEDIEIKLVRNRLRWLGHLSWKEDESHAVKALLFGELNDGKCPIGRPKIRYKDTCRCALRRGDVMKDFRGEGRYLYHVCHSSFGWRRIFINFIFTHFHIWLTHVKRQYNNNNDNISV